MAIQVGLTPKQRRFVVEYLKCFNASKAARESGYSLKTAHRIGQENLQKPAIQLALRTALMDAPTPERVLQEIARLAFLDVRKLYDEHGELKPVSAWDDDIAAAVAGLDSLQGSETGDGQKVPAGVLKKIRLWNKTANLELLAKHLRLLQDEKKDTVVNVQVNVTTPLTEALSRAYNARTLPRP